MNRPAWANASAPLEEELPEQVEEAPVGRVQLQSRVDPVLTRALCEGSACGQHDRQTRCCLASQWAPSARPDETVELDEGQASRVTPASLPQIVQLSSLAADRESK